MPFERIQPKPPRKPIAPLIQTPPDAEQLALIRRIRRGMDAPHQCPRCGAPCFCGFEERDCVHECDSD